MDSNEIQPVSSRVTNKKLILLTVLPSILVVGITVLLIPHYSETYSIGDAEKYLIWRSFRNIFNILMVGVFILANIIWLISWKLKKTRFSYSIFLAHFLISLILLNFSYSLLKVTADIIVLAKSVVNSLPLAMNFSRL